MQYLIENELLERGWQIFVETYVDTLTKPSFDSDRFKDQVATAQYFRVSALFTDLTWIALVSIDKRPICGGELFAYLRNNGVGI